MQIAMACSPRKFATEDASNPVTSMTISEASQNTLGASVLNTNELATLLSLVQNLSDEHEEAIQDEPPGSSQLEAVNPEQGPMEMKEEWVANEAIECGFMEDHIEYRNDCEERVSILESTLDNSVVLLRKPKRPKLHKVKSYEYSCHYCCYASHSQNSVKEHIKSRHPGNMSKITINYERKPKERNCPYCNAHLLQLEFFQHMRVCHVEAHPYKCGYCTFMGRDTHQVKQHIQKKHKTSPFKCINVLKVIHRGQQLMSTTEIDAEKEKHSRTLHEPNSSELENEDSDEITVTDPADLQTNLQCPICSKPMKTFKYLKAHMQLHKRARYKCSYCEYMSVQSLQVTYHQQTKHKSMAVKVEQVELEPDNNIVVDSVDDIWEQMSRQFRKKPREKNKECWVRRYNCPHCDYTCNFPTSFSRHLKLHANHMPFRCNYCSFKGRERYYVRRHIHRIHKGLPKIVLDNIPENCQNDSSEEEEEENNTCQKKKKRQRRRKPNQDVRPVIPVEEVILKEAGIKQKDGFPKAVVPSEDMVVPQSEDPVVTREIPSEGGDIEWQFQPEMSAVELLAQASQVVFQEELEASGTQNAPEEAEIQLESPAAVQPEPEHLENSTPLEIPPVELPGVKTKRKALWGNQNVHDFIAKKEEKHVTCVCGVRTVTKAFYKHVKTHCKVKPFKCGHCQYRSIERAKVRVHNAFVHPDLPVLVEEMSVNEEKAKFHMCHICDQEVPRLLGPAMDHFARHYSFFPYQCGLCGFLATSVEDVKNHGVTHHRSHTVFVQETGHAAPEAFQEALTYFVHDGFKQEETTRIKRQAANDESAADKEAQMFTCPLCTKTMKCHSSTVRRHFYTHYSYRPFKCGHCSYLGMSAGEIKQHTVSHGDNVKPHIETSSHLPPEGLEDMIAEFLEEVKVGRKRDKEGSSQSEMKTVEGQVWRRSLLKGKCPWCKEDMKQPRPNAFRHFKTHFNYKPFKCAYCLYYCAEEAELIRHQLSKHPELPGKSEGPLDNKQYVVSCLLQHFMDNPEEICSLNTLEADQVGVKKTPDGDILITDDFVTDIQMLLRVQTTAGTKRKTYKSIELKKCAECQMQFKKNSSLLVHRLKEHSEEAPAFRCQQCSYWHFSRGAVRRHLLSVHGGCKGADIVPVTRTKDGNLWENKSKQNQDVEKTTFSQDLFHVVGDKLVNMSFVPCIDGENVSYSQELQMSERFEKCKPTVMESLNKKIVVEYISQEPPVLNIMDSRSSEVD